MLSQTGVGAGSSLQAIETTNWKRDECWRDGRWECCECTDANCWSVLSSDLAYREDLTFFAFTTSFGRNVWSILWRPATYLKAKGV
ncbi:hypothetical protein TcWFU_004764 [Taenia crassiceps]|uniref:Uncharacterized protein n=1 Tax=Taenia crassiceps TaxID=6207 RepID=A0ABR4Q1I5_9CEST